MKVCPVFVLFPLALFLLRSGRAGHRSAYEQAMELDPNNRMAAYNLVRKKNERRGLGPGLRRDARSASCLAC